ncbi:uncharacterized membrane protein YciS (DUF1049 family) [Chryseobacterium defluvii]|uniref:Uncharacterized membrane protein YciS (DUF1049 family) n=1 Tax=Chryseobacterium defluvii TaxID=160396 RepID=A0A840KHS8_9FLAO|nr:DUF2975 domain-containing protein [Chryseobacterium defluvii]MBB4807578.1 uncharacterized membrane protein YciS (DUF1049 family) [Chryseobacterium defluvii]
MKLIGENSLSTILNKLLLIGFFGQVLYLGYLLFGFIVSFINQNTGSHYFPQTFRVGNFGDEIKKTNPEALSFQFKMPFSDAVTKGDYTIHTLISIIFFLGFYSMFTFYLFKIFKGMSNDIIFNKKVIIYLKQFALLNILFIPFYCILLFFIDQSLYQIDPIFILLHLSTGIIILFIMEFFKKGYELQTQTDLTI